MLTFYIYMFFRFFNDMITLYEKPIFITIEMCGLTVGLTSSLIIQIIRVRDNNLFYQL